MAELNIYGPIGEIWDGEGVTASSFTKELSAIDPAEPLDIFLSSSGGSVFQGLTIYDQIVRRPGENHFILQGVAASIASIIPMAGDSITMGQSARVMIHNPMGPSALAFGTSHDLREAAADTIKTADLLDSVKGTLIDIYASRTKLTKSDIGAKMDAETWLTAKEALAAGFADKVTANKTLAAASTTLRSVDAVRDVDELVAVAELCERMSIRNRRQPSADKLRMASARIAMLPYTDEATGLTLTGHMNGWPPDGV